MPGVDAAGADHGAFPAEHAALEHFHGLFLPASLEAVEHLPQAHSAEGSCRAGGAAGAARHAFPRIRFELVQSVEQGEVHLVHVDRRAGGDAESEDVFHGLPLGFFRNESISRVAESASARVSGMVFGPVQAPA